MGSAAGAVTGVLCGLTIGRPAATVVVRGTPAHVIGRSGRTVVWRAGVQVGYSFVRGSDRFSKTTGLPSVENN